MSVQSTSGECVVCSHCCEGKGVFEIWCLYAVQVEVAGPNTTGVFMLGGLVSEASTLRH